MGSHPAGASGSRLGLRPVKEWKRPLTRTFFCRVSGLSSINTRITIVMRKILNSTYIR